MPIIQHRDAHRFYCCDDEKVENNWVRWGKRHGALATESSYDTETYTSYFILILHTHALWFDYCAEKIH